MRRLKIQYASDLHLEISGRIAATHLLQPVAPILVLAGDNGDPTTVVYRDFLRECGQAWKHVVVVAGDPAASATQITLSNSPPARQPEPVTAVTGLVDNQTAPLNIVYSEKLAAVGRNVHFLDRGRVVIGGLAFLGCTLRTEDRAWLEGELAACREEGRGAVVVTDHPPTADLGGLIEEPVRAWIYGHAPVGGIAFKGAGGRIPSACNPRRRGFCGNLFLEASTEVGAGCDERDPEIVAAASATLPLEKLALT